METFSALLALCVGNSPVTGEFPTQRPVTRSFDVFFDLRLNTRLSKQWWCWWFETPSRSLWRHFNAMWQWESVYCNYVHARDGGTRLVAVDSAGSTMTNLWGTFSSRRMDPNNPAMTEKNKEHDWLLFFFLIIISNGETSCTWIRK